MQTVSKELAFFQSQSGEAKRIASLYRHNVDREPGENPELFGRLMQKMPEELIGDGYAELAAYTSLTLAAFAGNIGTTDIAKAIFRTKDNESLIRRFRNAEAAKDMSELRCKLRRVLKIMASRGQTVDYSVLAAELYRWQFSKAGQIRKWERKLVK